MKTLSCRIAILLATVAFSDAATAQSERSEETSHASRSEEPSIVVDTLRAVAKHAETRIRFFKADTSKDSIIHCDITCPRGIDRAVISRTSPDWPNQWMLRFHLKGLESLTMKSEQMTLKWSVSSSDGHSVQMSQMKDGQEVTITSSHPLYSPVKVVNGQSIPLENGYFEVKVPRALLEGNPESITCEWIDFYRN